MNQGTIVEKKKEEEQVYYLSKADAKKLCSKYKKITEKNNIEIYDFNNEYFLTTYVCESKERGILENDFKNKQLVIGALIHSGPKYFLLKNIKGDMKGFITLIQGHVSREFDLDFVETKSIFYPIILSLFGEFKEEVDLKGNNFKMERVPRYIVNCNSEDESISNKHIGFIYDLCVPEHVFDVMTSNEPEKNESVKININELSDNDYNNMDSWLSVVIDCERNRLS